MSNRDSMYGDSTHTDPWEAAQRRPESESSSGTSGKAQHAADEAMSKGADAMNKAEQKGQQARQKAEQMAGKAEAKADQGMHKAAEGMDQAAEKLRQQGAQQGGTMGSMATTAADTLDSASSYLRTSDTNQMMDDVEAYIRKNPTQSLLIAAGVGFVLSKVFK